MKKTISITIIVLLALGLAYFLFKISPKQPSPNGQSGDYDRTSVISISEPRAESGQDFVLGNPQAKNTAIIYEDFECPACATFSPIAEQIPLALQDTKLVFRHFPLPQHSNAIQAAYAAEAAGKQGKFWEMYSQLYSSQDAWANLADPLNKLAELAQAAGVVDINGFKTDIQNKLGKDKIQADLTESLSLQIQGTPTLYFNGKLLQLGALDQIKAQAEKLYR